MVRFRAEVKRRSGGGTGGGAGGGAGGGQFDKFDIDGIGRKFRIIDDDGLG
jgi:hypothetical protein